MLESAQLASLSTLTKAVPVDIDKLVFVCITLLLRAAAVNWCIGSDPSRAGSALQFFHDDLQNSSTNSINSFGRSA